MAPSQENLVTFDPDFHLRELRPACRRIKELVEFRGYEIIKLDFSRTRTAFADAMLPLASIIYKYRKDGVKFHLVESFNPRLNRIMRKSAWLKLMTGNENPDEDNSGDLNAPAQRFYDPDTQTSSVERLLDNVLRLVTRLDRNHLRALEWSLLEVTGNVLDHSESELGGLIQLVLKPSSQEIQFVVADSGIGIAQSLRNGLGNNWSDEWALEQAVKEGVTSGKGQGNGLYGTLRIATVSGGAFSINSGHAFLSLSRDGRTVAREEDIIYDGTTVDCTISFAKPLLLERALNFKIAPNHIPLDIIDLSYDHDGDHVLRIDLAKETRTVGSRIAGRFLRQKLLNLMRLGGMSAIEINCGSIGLIASSFADELFVKMLIELDEQNFGSKVRITSVSEVNQMIINRSRAQRIKAI